MAASLAQYGAACASALAAHARRYTLEWGIALVALASLLLASYLVLAAPYPFPSGATVVVAEGEPAVAVARALGAAGVVREPLLLRLWWRATGATIPAGAYRFAGPESLPGVAWRLAEGRFGIPAVRVTLPEGTTVLDAAKRVSAALPQISAADFVSAGGPYEGYLFPDTYTLQPSATAASIVKEMRANFNAQTASLAGDIAASGHSLSDIVIMASIIEREAARPEDRAMISGILWNRIERGMPLQVDAVFGYIYSRQTFSPSYANLGVDSPYNTYTHKGLPPGPICNPGLSAIEAALHPATTKYLYYLTGHDGLMHYATTYAGHKANLQKYLY